jgi:hypothetical protein
MIQSEYIAYFDESGDHGMEKLDAEFPVFADSVAKLLNAVRHRLFSVGLRRIRSEDTARDFVDSGGRTRSHYGRGRAGRGGEKLKSLATGVAGNCEGRGRD